MKKIKEFGFDISSLKSYSGYYYDTRKLRTSASGGIGSAIAENFILNGGIVFGVTYAEDFRSALYCCANCVEDIEKMKGSKYIASKKEMLLNGKYVSVYKVLQESLQSGHDVLFTGLGCDVGAILQYCHVNNVDTSKLYTIDLICHGPTSPQVAEQFLDSLEASYESKVTEFSVRYKKEGWVPPYLRVVFESGEIFEEPFYKTDYSKAFSIFVRPSCFQCRFRGQRHAADITIGDYWGMIKKEPEYNMYGVSIAFVNDSDKGNKLISMIDRNSFYLQEADTERALRGNPNYYKCIKKPYNYDKFTKKFSQHGLHYAVQHSAGVRGKVKMILKKVLPQPIIEILKKLRAR